MWFDSWNDLARIVLVGTCGYLGLVALLRISGKRTLAKLNAFDFVVTIAIGSTLATIALDPRTSLADGLVALWLLIALQFLAAKATAWAPWLRRLVTAEASLLLIDGEPNEWEMRRRRVSVEDLHQAVRASGLGDLSLVAAVVLETDGSMSVVGTSGAGDRSALPPAVAGADTKSGGSVPR